MVGRLLLKTGNITPETLFELPTDVVVGLDFYSSYLSLLENLPTEYRPKGWEWLFDDEVEKKINAYLKSLKSDKVKTEQEEITSDLAEIVKKSVTGEV